MFAPDFCSSLEFAMIGQSVSFVDIWNKKEFENEILYEECILLERTVWKNKMNVMRIMTFIESITIKCMMEKLNETYHN